MKVRDIIKEDGVIVPGVNTTPDVKPGETERQAKKFFGGDGKPKPLGVKGATPNQAFNLGLVEEAAKTFYENMSYTAKRVRDTEKKRNIKIGSDEWFKLWFSLPYLKESVEDVRSFANQLESKYDLQTLFLSDLGERNAIEIASIIVKKENQKSGTGTEVMKEIVRYADQNGKILVLTPGLFDKKHGTTSQSRLTKFYKRFGFVENKGRNKNYEFKQSMIRYPQNSESALSESYKMQLERADDMYILHILDTKTKQRTEVRGSKGYESGNYDSNDRLHKLLDVIGRSVNVSELMNGEVVTINPKHPDAARANKHADTAFNEAFDTEVEWIEGAAPEGASVYAAKVDDAYIEITYKPIKKGVYISFTRGARMSVTGEGGQNKIFGAVINHIKQWVAKNKPQEIYFSAFKPRTGAFGSQDDTRSGLYRKMVQRFASQNGYDYNVEDTGNEDTFILKRQDVEENLSEGKEITNNKETNQGCFKMKLSEILNIDFPQLEEAMSKEDIIKQLDQKRKERFVDAMLNAMHRLVTSKGDTQSIGGYAYDISRSFGFPAKELEKLYREKFVVNEGEADEYEITQSMLDMLEKYIDKLFAAVGIDVEFTRHFLDRVNDERNKKPITLKELALLFKDAYVKYGKKIAKMGPDAEAVIKDMRTDVNIPFVLNWDNRNNELDLVAKTVMRKKNFMSRDPSLPVG